MDINETMVAIITLIEILNVGILLTLPDMTMIETKTIITIAIMTIISISFPAEMTIISEGQGVHHVIVIIIVVGVIQDNLQIETIPANEAEHHIAKT